MLELCSKLLRNVCSEEVVNLENRETPVACALSVINVLLRCWEDSTKHLQEGAFHLVLPLSSLSSHLMSDLKIHFTDSLSWFLTDFELVRCVLKLLEHVLPLHNKAAARALRRRRRSSSAVSTSSSSDVSRKQNDSMSSQNNQSTLDASMSSNADAEDGERETYITSWGTSDRSKDTGKHLHGSTSAIANASNASCNGVQDSYELLYDVIQACLCEIVLLMYRVRFPHIRNIHDLSLNFYVFFMCRYL